MESRFGHDFSQVRVHTDAQARDSASAVHAQAYTVGHHIVMGTDRQPYEHQTRQLLAHELAHVLQQRNQPNGRLGTLNVSDPGDPAELEAEQIARATETPDQWHPNQGYPKAELAAGPSLQRTCGPALIGSTSGCVLRGGAVADFGASSEDVFRFRTGCDEFLPGEEKRLASYATRIGLDNRVAIDGFASEEGPTEFNEDLSCARTHAAAAVLVAAGVSSNKVDENMHGATPGFRPANRSVVITVVPVPPAQEEPTQGPKQEKRRIYPTVRVWVNSFIPHARVDGPPGSECFAGDDRGFSSDPSASSRTHQEIEVKAGQTSPTSDIRRIGTTHEVDCSTGAVLDSDTASIDELENGAVVGQRTTADAHVYFVADASNPLVTGAPAIDLEAEFHLDLVSRSCRFEMDHDGFPGYEAYLSADGAPPVQVYAYDPRAGGEGIRALFPPMDKSIRTWFSF